jgi:hypothetical protein
MGSLLEDFYRKSWWDDDNEERRNAPLVSLGGWMAHCEELIPLSHLNCIYWNAHRLSSRVSRQAPNCSLNRWPLQQRTRTLLSVVSTKVAKVFHSTSFCIVIDESYLSLHTYSYILHALSLSLWLWHALLSRRLSLWLTLTVKSKVRTRSCGLLASGLEA